MYTSNDLYDLHTVLLRIRLNPSYKYNALIMSEVILSIENCENSANNCIRKALRNIPKLDKDVFAFIFVDNYYTYIPFILKEEKIYKILKSACKALLLQIQSNNTKQVVALADCLHNLPIDISRCGTIPKSFWKNNVRVYREQWDKEFLR